MGMLMDYRCTGHFLRIWLRATGLHTDPMKLPECGWWLRFVVAVLALGFGETLLGQMISQSHVDEFDGHPRIIVISDIGNEPDQMSLIRLLYSNELDVEGGTTSNVKSRRVSPVI